jgi:transcriptional regulator with XRE-family HTH domain
MLTLDQIREKLQDRRLSVVSEACGISHSYLHLIVNGKRVNPTYEVVKKLSDYLEK